MATIAYGLEVLEFARLQNLILVEQINMGTINPIDAKQKAHHTKIMVEHELNDVYNSYTDAKNNEELTNLKTLVYSQWKELDEFADRLVKENNNKPQEPEL